MITPQGNEIDHLLEGTGHPNRTSETAEEVLVGEFVEGLRARWEKLEPGVDTCYTFQGYMGQQLMFARELLYERKSQPNPSLQGAEGQETGK